MNFRWKLTDYVKIINCISLKKYGLDELKANKTLLFVFIFLNEYCSLKSYIDNCVLKIKAYIAIYFINFKLESS